MRSFVQQGSFIRLAAAAFLLSLVIGCTDDPPAGTDPGLGGRAFTKYVAVGNSLTAGYQSNGLYESAQMYSYPRLIAQQLRAAGATLGSFEQPIYSDPGNPASNGKAARYELISLLGPQIGPRGLAPGTPTNLALSRPYDNLGLPGAPLAAYLDATGTYHGSFGPIVIRSSSGFPASPHRQLKVLNPDLVTFWLGANDVLGYATSGGVSPSAPTAATTFSALYTQALDSLRAAVPNAVILVATLPDVSGIPFFTTTAGRVKSNPNIQAAFAAGGSFCYQNAGEPGTGTGQTTFSSATGEPLVTLLGGVPALSLGLSTYAPYRSLGPPYDNYSFAQSVGIDSTQPFGLHPNNPFPGAYVLDAGEQAIARQAVSDYNATIRSVAASKGALVWDAHGLFAEIAATGYAYRGYTFTIDYVTGGLFSLDGVHPSSRGYGIVANEMITLLNRELGMSVPLVDIFSIPGLEAPTLTKGEPSQMPMLPVGAGRELVGLFGGSLTPQ